MFLKAAKHAELDIMRGVSANVMCGQEGNYGTSAFQVLADESAFMNYEFNAERENNLQNDADELYVKDNEEDYCNLVNIKIENNTNTILQNNTAIQDDDNYMPDF